MKLGYLYDIIFQSSSKQFHFQSSTSRQSNNTVETSTFPSIYIFKRSNPILQLIFQNFGMFIFFMTSLFANSGKRAQNWRSCIGGDRKIKINIWQNFEVKSFFLRSPFQNIAVLSERETKLVFHVPMVIEIWKSIVERNMRWSIRFCNIQNWPGKWIALLRYFMVIDFE